MKTQEIEKKLDLLLSKIGGIYPDDELLNSREVGEVLSVNGKSVYEIKRLMDESVLLTDGRRRWKRSTINRIIGELPSAPLD